MAATIERFVESFGEALASAGMPRMAARVFGALLATDDGSATAADLTARLKASPAAISGAVAYLAQVGMITRRRELGERRDRYRLHGDVWYETLANRDEQMKRWSQTMQAGVDAVGADTPAGRRLAETRDFFAFMADELPRIWARWREQQDHANRP